MKVKKVNRRSLPVDRSYKAGLQNNSSRKSNGTLDNCELSSSQKKTQSEESQLTHENYPNMENQTKSDIEATSSEEHLGDSGHEDSADETAKAIVRSKAIFFSVLIFFLALCGMGILVKSTCGGSLSFKLLPPELQLNTGSCTQTE